MTLRSVYTEKKMSRIEDYAVSLDRTTKGIIQEEKLMYLHLSKLAFPLRKGGREEGANLLPQNIYSTCTKTGRKDE